MQKVLPAPKTILSRKVRKALEFNGQRDVFSDHLEELRWRIIKAAVAVVIAAIPVASTGKDLRCSDDLSCDFQSSAKAYLYQPCRNSDDKYKNCLCRGLILLLRLYSIKYGNLYHLHFTEMKKGFCLLHLSPLCFYCRYSIQLSHVSFCDEISYHVCT